MTATIAGPPTSTGTPLPLIALPQTNLLSVNEHDLPLLTDALGEGVSFKPLRLDVERNCWVVLAHFAPGVELPIHYHTGPAEVFTLQGRWLYKEYPDDPQTAGSYLFEPGGSVHTFYTPSDNTEETILLVRVEGANVNFTEDGQFHSILDTPFIEHMTRELSAQQGVGPLRYIRGGETTAE